MIICNSIKAEAEDFRAAVNSKENINIKIKANAEGNNFKTDCTGEITINEDFKDSKNGEITGKVNFSSGIRPAMTVCAIKEKLRTEYCSYVKKICAIKKDLLKQKNTILESTIFFY